MKFTMFALFTLALAMGAQGSIIPWGVPAVAGHGLAYTAVGPAVGHVVSAPASVAVHVASPWGVAGVGPWGVVGPSAAVVAAHGSVVAAPHAAVVVASGHEGSYVAKTRGAIHTAPLAGHVASAAAINVAPAPGTV